MKRRERIAEEERCRTAEKERERRRADEEERERCIAAAQQEDELAQQDKKSLALLQPKKNKEVCPPMVCKISKRRKRVTWIMRDKCEQWYHIDCVGLTAKSVRSIDTWMCDLCR